MDADETEDPFQEERARQERQQRRDSLRAERLAHRDRVVAEREGVRSRREASLRGMNLCLGLMVQTGMYRFSAPSDRYEGTRAMDLTGMSLAIRSHYTRWAGVQGGLEMTSGGGYDARMVSMNVKHLFGPFGRFVIEPGLGYTLGWSRHEAGQDGGAYTGRIGTVDMGLDMSFYLGDRDQFPITLGWKVALDSRSSVGATHVKVAYALPLD